MRLLFSRKGDAYAWFAALMVFVAIPLSSLSIDVTRMMYVRGHLQTATDAACQSAADALDVPLFIATNEKRIDAGLARRQAAREFSATLRDAGRVRYTIEGLAIDFPAPTFAHCVASVTVERIIPMTPTMKVVVETTSEMRAQAVTTP
ncbi:MAG: hypothetical protein HYR70_04325 [Chloroflexi bacterium]|nr:hypothetical protein [Chloroflexota bacterium]MBI3340783.1 hypothetical protein [Chloroflexota bacterium]